MFPLLIHSILNFPWLLIFSLSPHSILQTSTLLLLIIPLPGTQTLTFRILITTLLHAQLQICPALSFPHTPPLPHPSHHPSPCPLCNQIAITQAHHERL